MASLNVFDASVVFRVVCQVASGSVVNTERGSPLGTATQFVKEIARVG